MRRWSLAVLLALLWTAGCDLLTSPSSSRGESDEVQIRVFNNSDYRFENVTVNGVAFGAIPPGDFSEYREVPGAYHYGAVSLEIDGERFGVSPIDDVGETHLPPS
ncbi:MAG: hypothetical protein ACR2H9_22505, partial [Longimicrobiaceae bacterium]